MNQAWKFLQHIMFFGTIGIIALGPNPALGLDVSYECHAAPDSVFHGASVAVNEMTDWRSIRMMDRERTIKAVVRNWRNFGVPIWIQVRPSNLENPTDQSELHLLWEQAMEPLNYPDLYPFLTTFERQQQTLGLNCVWTGTNIGL